MELKSTAFKDGERIPVKYTCEGQNISPSLTWSDVPEDTRSFALMADDPDAPAGIFTHWVIFNIPLNSRELPEAVPTKPQLAGDALQGRSDFGSIGYGGPCPPPGKPHHYNFTLYALDKLLELPTGTSKRKVLDAMPGHILAQAELVGIYQR